MLRVVLIFSLTAAASAQTRYATEVCGHAGGGSTWDGEGSIGSGVTVAANVSRRLTAKIAVEGDFNYFRHKREL
ncbi:MAG TPA: hypothetical protein VFL57_18900, partial [Bryobacteraceae bacterium]|nr:hypothetical protein [Bryobacteraceae bacterium]